MLQTRALTRPRVCSIMRIDTSRLARMDLDDGDHT
jgi:hypothetical protein